MGGRNLRVGVKFGGGGVSVHNLNISQKRRLNTRIDFIIELSTKTSAEVDFRVLLHFFYK